MANLFCRACGFEYPAAGVSAFCPKCGGLFDYRPFPRFEKSLVQPDRPGIWRYRSLLELPDHVPELYLGEGDTPLVWDRTDGAEVGFKLESLNPTGSYKDRGTAVLVSQLAARGVTAAVEDSSGNAGASFAAYAARAGMKARVFVPESASGPKVNQIRYYGADLVQVPGPRSASAQAVLRELDEGAVYASHAFLPFGLPGIATIAYELFEQMGGSLPGTVIAPAGHGALLLGIVRGFASLCAGGYAANRPYFVGVQAAACAPLAALFLEGPAAVEGLTEGQTLAEGVRVRNPARADALRAEILPGQGEIIAVSEPEIEAAFHRLARRGIFAEPTAALAWAAFERLKGNLPEPIILIISGLGLKLGQI